MYIVTYRRYYYTVSTLQAVAPDSLNEEHSGQLAAYSRFAKYQRGQCIKSVTAAVRDTKETRVLVQALANVFCTWCFK